MEKITLQVEGMSCGHCEKAVTNALTGLGATKVKASARKKTVEVTFDPKVLTTEDIKNEIIEAGYYSI
jgi:copper chaperone